MWFFLAKSYWAVPPAADNGAGTAQGDAVVSGFLEDATPPVPAAVAPRGLLARWMGGAAVPRGDVTLECDGSATGDATCSGQIEDATPAVVVVTPPPVDAGGVSQFAGVWRNRPGFSKKKKKRLDDLGEMIAVLRSRVEEVPEPLPDLERTLRVSLAVANQADPSLADISNQIALLKAAIEEIDDEEAVIMLLAA